MASPTFNGLKIFDSKKAGGTQYSEGVLWAQDYSGIIQPIHFNGEDGNTIINHGWPDRAWTFRGLLSADTLANLKGIFRAIQDEIDAGNSGTYHTLVDSFGNVYTHARVLHLHIANIHVSDDGYVSEVTVDGIIQSMVHDGETA